MPRQEAYGTLLQLLVGRNRRPTSRFFFFHRWQFNASQKVLAIADYLNHNNNKLFERTP
jgi:hypothetical protein